MTPKQRIRNHLNSLNAGTSEQIDDIEFHVDALYECATADVAEQLDRLLWRKQSEEPAPNEIVLVRRIGESRVSLFNGRDLNSIAEWRPL